MTLHTMHGDTRHIRSIEKWGAQKRLDLDDDHGAQWHIMKSRSREEGEVMHDEDHIWSSFSFALHLVKHVDDGLQWAMKIRSDLGF